MIKRLLLGVVVVVLGLGALVWTLRSTLAMRAIERVVATNIATDLMSELPDGLHVALCGAGSPLPDPKRSGPCVAVIAGERLFVVDSGAGSSRVMARMRIPMGRIEGVLLTHFHSDHIDGLGELLLQRWVNGARERPTPVHGPPGVEEVVAGFNRAYSADRGYRVAHHGAEIVPPSGHGGEARPFALPSDDGSVVLVDDGGLVITAFSVEHQPIEPAVGYRFDYGGRSVLISGDTVKLDRVRDLATGVDLLVHEALDPELVSILTDGARAAGRDRLAQITVDILDYHATPEDAAEIARDAGVGHLLYYHVVPPLLVGPMETIFLEGVDSIYEGPVTVGRDGTLVVMPSGDGGIEVDEVL